MINPVRHIIRVIYGDTDQMGIVYYANYLRYFEAGRNEWLRAQNFTYRDFEQYSVRLPVVNAKIDYKISAHYDDEIIVCTKLLCIKKASLEFNYEILKSDQVLAIGNTRHACVNFDGKIVPFPKAIQNFFCQ